MFRSSSISVAREFRFSPHPHANVIAENAFERGLVRSATDYGVYTKAGVPGIDLAFFKRRAVYHTKDDSVPTLSGKRALWSMLESAYYTGRAMADDEHTESGSRDRAVYFDRLSPPMLSLCSADY